MSSCWGFLSRMAEAGRELPLDRTMLRRNAKRAASAASLLCAATLLSGCDMALLDPKGPIGSEERSIIILSTVLMLVVVVPVIVMTIAFAWRYRASNTAATFAPDWEHSTRIEAVVWAVPCVIIAILATVTWISTHKLDPFRPIDAAVKPVEVEVVAMDWKWLFIYPEQKIATVNEMALPVGVPVSFKITSASVMNSFFIPQLGSQIYAMAGMETRLNLQADHVGDYEGISANYSGQGFSDMKFNARAMTQADFEAWVAKAKAAPAALSMAAYRQLAQPSQKNPVAYYGTVETTLFHDVLNKCSDGARCTDDAVRFAMAQQLDPNAPLCTPANPKGL